jgi:hypothetical protein
MDPKSNSKPITLYYGIETSRLNQILKDLYELSMGFVYEDYEKEARKYIQNSAKILEEPVATTAPKTKKSVSIADTADIILSKPAASRKKKPVITEEAAVESAVIPTEDAAEKPVEITPAKTVCKKKKMSHIPHNMIEVWHEEISGQVYLVDRFSNVFTNNLDNPTLIGYVQEDNTIGYLDGYEGW